MRIAFIVSHFPRLSETFILNQVTGLIDRGHHVDIFSEYDGDWEHVHPDVTRYQLHRHTYPLQSVPRNYLGRSLKGLWLLLSRWPKAPRLLARSLNVKQHGLYAGGLWLLYAAASLIDSDCPQYDIIHCQFGTQGYRGWFLQCLMQPQPKLVVMFRGHDISSYVQQQGEQVYKDLWQAADACLTNCEFFRQRVIQLGCPPAKIAVHYSGLDVTKFTYKARQLVSNESIQLITTGRLVEKKGIEYVIRALVPLVPRYPHIRYSIIGDGPLRPSLESLIRDLQLESVVHLVGWQDEHELIASLEQAHLFIAPSVTAQDGNQDAPINVLKEAMAMGLPVISTVHGGIPELVQEGIAGYLVPERDVAALAASLDRLLQQHHRWPTMGQAGRAYVEEHFNIQTLNNQLVSRYQDLLHTEVPPPPSLSLANSLI